MRVPTRPLPGELFAWIDHVLGRLKLIKVRLLSPLDPYGQAESAPAPEHLTIDLVRVDSSTSWSSTYHEPAEGLVNVRCLRQNVRMTPTRKGRAA
jgi:hypothetical protein